MTNLLDEQVVGRQVGDRLSQLAGELDVSSLPSWPGIQKGLRRSVRRRRARRAGVLAGALATVVTLGGTVQLGLLPYPSWAPAVTMASSGPSALAEQPTKGSLSGDDAWLEGLRVRVSGERTEESGGESWSVGDPDDVVVLFAGDVGGHRLAAVEAPYRWGVVEARQQVWYLGPEGASPEELVQVANGEVADVLATAFGPDIGYADALGSTGVLVLTPDAREVVVETAPQYQADGSVVRPTEVLPPLASGVYVWLDPTGDPGGVTARVAGLDGGVQVNGGWRDDLLAGADVRPGRGSELDDEQVRLLLAQSLEWFGVPAGSVSPELVWAGRDAAVLALRVPSGAALVTTARAESPEGGEVTYWREAGFVLPAGEPVYAAWQQATMDFQQVEGGWSGSTAALSKVGMVGPPEAVTAELLDATGTVVGRAALVDGGGTAEAPGAATARFLAPDGAPLATVDVRPWQEDGPPWMR